MILLKFEVAYLIMYTGSYVLKKQHYNCYITPAKHSHCDICYSIFCRLVIVTIAGVIGKPNLRI